MTERIKVNGDEIQRLHAYLEKRLDENDVGRTLIHTTAFWCLAGSRDDLDSFMRLYHLDHLANDREVLVHCAAILKRRRTQLRHRRRSRLGRVAEAGG